MGPKWSDVADGRNKDDISDYHDDYDEPKWDPYERPDRKPRFDDERDDDDPAKKPAPNPWWGSKHGDQPGNPYWRSPGGEPPPQEPPQWRTGFGTDRPYRGSTDKRTPFDVDKRWRDVAEKYKDVRHPSGPLKKKIEKEMRDRGLSGAEEKRVYDHNGWH